LDRGFGFAVVTEGRIVSWAMSDCVVHNKAEIGVYTMPEYRRQGLGVCAASAAVEFALGERKIELIGWHCNEGNIASQKTAEKVGFKLNIKHQRHYIVRPIWRHHAELGLRDFHTGDYQGCVERYRYVFGQTNEAENHIYHLAAMAAGKLGDKNDSIIWLKKAAERGWKNLNYTNSRSEFNSLRRTSEWDLIIQKIKENN
jgi:GNAT superfamily N-acetyltransferase